jgi:SNF family Na+-dependent transporter
MVCATTAVMVCLLNITLTIWAVTNHQLVDGLSYLYTGSCQEVAKMSLWIHLGINAMSTMLLSASNCKSSSSLLEELSQKD